MDLSTQAQDILLHMMTFLNVQSIGRLAQCSKQFLTLSRMESLWKIKLIEDYKMIAAKDTNKESYKWKFTINVRLDFIWKDLEAGPYDLPPELKPHIGDAIITAGPQMDIDVIWKKLDLCPFDLPIEMKPLVKQSITKMLKSKKVAELETQVTNTQKELQLLLVALQAPTIDIDIALDKLKNLQSVFKSERHTLM